jgi:hypothetical protein
MMTDANAIATQYIDLWNERNPIRRRELLMANWAKAAKYVDPMMNADGHDAINDMIAGVQERFPEFIFKLIGKPDGYGSNVRFSWGLGPEGADSPIKGTDFAVIQEERIQTVTGFLDQIPQST